MRAVITAPPPNAARRRGASARTPSPPRRVAMVSVTNASRSRRPCRCRSMSIGKSREGRQSPYQDDFSAPPRPKTSSSGSSSFISGVGTPDQDDRAGQVAGVEGLLVRLRAAHRLDHHVRAEAAGQLTDRLDGSRCLELTVWVAPISRAVASFRSSMSTAMILAAPARFAPAIGGVADAAAADHGDAVAPADFAGVDGRADAGHHAAAQQPCHLRVRPTGRPWCTGPPRPASSPRTRRCPAPATAPCRR